MTHCINKIIIIMFLNVMLGMLFMPRSYALENASNVVANLVQMMDANCKRKYSETSIQNAINNLPEYRREQMQITIGIQKTAECQCMPEKLRSLSDEKISELQNNSSGNAVQKMLGAMAMSCVATGYRKQWIPFCHAIMSPETDNQNKIETACLCMKKEVQKIDNYEFIQYAQKAINRYKNSTPGVTEEKNGKSEFVKASEACVESAGIEVNSDYKKRFRMQREEENKIDLAKIHLKTISLALDMYRLGNYKYPSQEQGLKILTVKPEKPSNANRSTPYLKKLPVDPWGNAYIYRVLDNGNKFELLSFGRDKKPEGTGPDQDIYHSR